MSSDPRIIYLHGFLSSPRSTKALQAAAYACETGLGDALMIPFLNQSPEDNLASLEALASEEPTRPLAVLGSSLGGFYATCLAERYRAPAVLINPAVRPHEYWRDYLGTHRNFHVDETYTVSEAHVRQLAAMCPLAPREPENYLVFLQRRDEVLDYRRAQEYYGEARCVVRDDGDHAYAEFASELTEAFAFLLSRIGRDVR